MPDAVTASSARPLLSRIEGVIWTITWITAPTPSPRRNADSSALVTDAPIDRTQDRGRAGDQAQAGESPDAGPLAIAHQRRDDREALGRVVDREADDKRGAQRQLGDRVGRTDRKPLPHVVKSDADRDHEREAEATRSALALALGRQVAVDRRQRHEGQARAKQDQFGAAERAAGLAGDLEAFEARIDRQERQ